MILTRRRRRVRISEAKGLTWDRVDLDRVTLRVDRRLADIDGDHPVFEPLKDEQNRLRTIPLPASVAAALWAHRASYGEGVDGLVFPSATGRPLAGSTWSQIWTAAAGPLGIEEGGAFHQLRHFYASTLIKAGESVKVIQKGLGHTSAQMTLDVYGHSWPDDDDCTGAAIDGVLAT
jgi:integrase